MVAILLFVLSALAPASADEAALREIIAKFATAKNFSATETIVRELVATGDPAVERPLVALSDGNLYFRKADKAVFIGAEVGSAINLSDPLSGESAGEAAKTEMTKVKVNNGLRRAIRDALGTLTLGSDDPAVRLAAAQNMFSSPDAANIGPLDAAIAKEQVASVKVALEDARASSVLVSDLPEADKLAAVDRIAARGDRAALSLLTAFQAQAEGSLKDAASSAVERIKASLVI